MCPCWACILCTQDLCLTGGSPSLSGASGGARPRAERGDWEAAGPGGAAGRGGQRGRGPAGPGEGGEDPRPEEGGGGQKLCPPPLCSTFVKCTYLMSVESVAKRLAQYL